MSKKSNLASPDFSGDFIRQVQAALSSKEMGFKLVVKSIQLEPDTLRSFQKGLESNCSQAVQKAFQSALSAPVKTSRVKPADSANRLALGKSQLTSQLDDTLTKTSGLTGDLKARFDALRTSIASVGNLDALEQLKEQLHALLQEVSQSGSRQGGLFSRLETQIRTVYTTLSSSAVFAKIEKELQNMAARVYEIEQAMTSLYRVTDDTRAHYEQFLTSTAQNAKRLGVDMKSLIDQTAAWAKSGYSLDQSAQLAKASALYANISGLDQEAAIQNLSAAMDVFQIKAGDSLSLVDKLNALGRESIQKSGDMGVALSQYADSLQKTGNTLDQSLAMNTGLADFIPNPNDSAKALEVISLRLHGMREELKKMGAEYETALPFARLQAQMANLTNNSVQFFDADQPGQLKASYDILSDIAGVMGQLSSQKQEAVLEIIGGDKYKDAADALLSSFQSGQVGDALNVSLGSAGSAMRDQEQLLSHLDGQVQKFQASLQALSMTAMNSGLLEFFVKLGTLGVDSLDSLLRTLGTIPTLSAALGGILAFKDVGGAKTSVAQMKYAHCSDKPLLKMVA